GGAGGDVGGGGGRLNGEGQEVRAVEGRPAFPEAGAASEVVIQGGQWVLRLEAEAPYPQVVLEVSPHAREVDDGLDAEMLQVSMGTNAGQQEEARRVDRPGAEDQLSRRPDGMQLAVQQEVQAGAACEGEPQLDRRRVGQ